MLYTRKIAWFQLKELLIKLPMTLWRFSTKDIVRRPQNLKKNPTFFEIYSVTSKQVRYIFIFCFVFLKTNRIDVTWAFYEICKK